MDSQETLLLVQLLLLKDNCKHQPSTPSTTQHRSLTQLASANPSTPSHLLSTNSSTISSPIQQQLLIQSSPSLSQASDQSVQPRIRDKNAHNMKTNNTQNHNKAT